MMTNKDKAERIFDTVLPRQWTKNDWIPALAAELDRIDSEEMTKRIQQMFASIGSELDREATLIGWPEDFNEENGNYFCECLDCGEPFIGHKRRMKCKPCSEKNNPPMTDSALVQEVRQAIKYARVVGSPHSIDVNVRNLASRLCDEFELIQQKIKQA